MRVLAVCESPPTDDPKHGNGTTMIAAAVLPRLAPDVELDLVYVGERPVGPSEAIAARCRRIVRLEPRSSKLEPFVLPFTQLPRGSWYRTPRGARETVASLAQEADVVYVHGLHAFSLVRDVTAPIVANGVDPWSIYWAELGREHRSLARRLYHRFQSKRAERLERSVAARASAYIVVNPNDADALRDVLPTEVIAIPNGVARVDQGAIERDEELVAFVGSLDYAPNVGAVRTLALEVFPVVRRRVPGARLVIAGRKPGPEVLGLAGEGVEVRADVDDIGAVLAGAAVAAFPETHGRGTRNSVLEAISAGCAVVATESSARGIAPGEHLVLATTPASVGEAVADLLLDRSRRERIATAARAAAERLPTWEGAAAAYAAALDAAARSTREGTPC